MRAHPSTHYRHSRRGAVILLVMVTVLLTAFLMSKFIMRVGTELLADARAADRDRLRGEAYSALEVTLAVLADVKAIDGALYAEKQGWADPLAYAGYEPQGRRTIKVSFEDESGKISLPAADRPTVQALLELAGLGRNEAEKASDALMVWSHKNYSPLSLDNDPASYESGSLPHKVPQRPFHSWAELAAVKNLGEFLYGENGQPTARLLWLMDHASLYSFNRINLNTAAPSVLSAAGLDTGRLDRPRSSSIQGEQFFRSTDEALSGAASDRFGVQVQVLRINIVVNQGAAEFTLSAVISLAGVTPGTEPDNKTLSAPRKKSDYPFRLLELAEETEARNPSSVTEN